MTRGLKAERWQIPFERDIVVNRLRNVCDLNLFLHQFGYLR